MCSIAAKEGGLVPVRDEYNDTIHICEGICMDALVIVTVLQ